MPEAVAAREGVSDLPLGDQDGFPESVASPGKSVKMVLENTLYRS